MKLINKFILPLFACFVISACTINDPIDDVFNIGQYVPTVYWQLVSTEVAAGDEVEFYSKYYSTLNKEKIKNVEVWYSLDQKSEYSIICPLFSDLKYSMQYEELIPYARPLQLIYSFVHKESNWNDREHAYILSSSFPTSFTLKPVEWGNQKEFNQDEFNNYFPEDILYRFRDSLYLKMNVPQFRKLLTVDNPRFTEDEFKQFVDTVEDANLGTVISIIDTYKPLIKQKMYEIPIDSLIYDSDPDRGYFSSTFKKSYSAKACFKVIDEKGNVGISEYKDVTIN